ncbi:MAG TPA: DUF4153 domain-containing protein [Clostridiaceae bacterium]|jgi:hypothetical protein|nr:DUF4153 domain-containing protein [Clostridiaceae bacterium]
MKIAKYIISLAKSIYKSIKRFPVTIAFSTAFVVMMIITSEIRSSSAHGLTENLNRVSMILALGVPLSLCIKLYFEKKNNYKLSHIISAFIGEGLILILYYFFLLEDLKMVSTTRYAGVTLALYIAFLFIPYFKDKENFELYVIKVFGRFFITIIYSAVLYGGLAAILATIDKLLGVKISSNSYYYTFLIVAGIFAPTYFLGGLPTIKNSFTKENYPNIFRVLVFYIVMPLISIYTLILYIYFAKIIILKQWPVGLVSHLVLWYAVISASVLFFISPIYKENSFAKKFMKFFPKLILPLIMLMFFSIGIRVNAYGITENRYYVIVLSLWVFGVMIYFSFAKKFKNIFLPITLSAIMIISVLGGPLSSYSISKSSQNKRLEKMLLSNNMLQDKKIVKASSISEKDKNEISSIISYFNSNHSLKDVKYLPKDFKMDDMEKTFGFQYSPNFSPQNCFYFNIMQTGEPIEISGYNYMFDSRYRYDEKESNLPFSISYDYNSNILKIYQNKDVLYTKDMNEFSKKLIDKYGLRGKGEGINPNEMCFEDENSKVKVKIQIINISGTKDPSTRNIKTNGIDFYILIKVK